jgi:hypothetical protein
MTSLEVGDAHSRDGGRGAVRHRRAHQAPGDRTVELHPDLEAERASPPLASSRAPAPFVSTERGSGFGTVQGRQVPGQRIQVAATGSPGEARTRLGVTNHRIGRHPFGWHERAPASRRGTSAAFGTSERHAGDGRPRDTEPARRSEHPDGNPFGAPTGRARDRTVSVRGTPYRWMSSATGGPANHARMVPHVTDSTVPATC